MKIGLFVPARLKSTRLPNKMLLKVYEDKTLLQTTFEQVKKFVQTSKQVTIDDVFILTDSESIQTHVLKFHQNVFLTPSSCLSGTNRIAKFIATSKLNFDIIVNIQGDEPLVNPLHIQSVIDGLSTCDWAGASTCAIKYSGSPLEDSSKVKVVVDSKNSALYFSRARIPFKGEYWRRHIGLYAYRPSVLKYFLNDEPSELERAENLEQLRILDYGHKIVVVDVSGSNDEAGVDTEEDLIRVRKFFQTLPPYSTRKN